MTMTAERPEEPIRFTKTKDKYGTKWSMYPSKYSKTKLLQFWVDRSNKDSEIFWLRQENDHHVNLISLDLGQAYDTLRALSEALGTND